MVRVVTIMSNETIELKLPADALLTLAMVAHDRDITLNELISDIMRNACFNEFVERVGVCLWCGTEAPLTRGYCRAQCEGRSHSNP